MPAQIVQRGWPTNRPYRSNHRGIRRHASGFTLSDVCVHANKCFSLAADADRSTLAVCLLATNATNVTDIVELPNGPPLLN